MDSLLRAPFIFRSPSKEAPRAAAPLPPCGRGGGQLRQKSTTPSADSDIAKFLSAAMCFATEILKSVKKHEKALHLP